MFKQNLFPRARAPKCKTIHTKPSISVRIFQAAVAVSKQNRFPRARASKSMPAGTVRTTAAAQSMVPESMLESENQGHNQLDQKPGNGNGADGYGSGSGSRDLELGLGLDGSGYYSPETEGKNQRLGNRESGSTDGGGMEKGIPFFQI